MNVHNSRGRPRSRLLCGWGFCHVITMTTHTVSPPPAAQNTQNQRSVPTAYNPPLLLLPSFHADGFRLGSATQQSARSHVEEDGNRVPRRAGPPFTYLIGDVRKARDGLVGGDVALGAHIKTVNHVGGAIFLIAKCVACMHCWGGRDLKKCVSEIGRLGWEVTIPTRP